jgi:hypothetical protein
VTLVRGVGLATSSRSIQPSLTHSHPHLLLRVAPGCRCQFGRFVDSAAELRHLGPAESVRVSSREWHCWVAVNIKGEVVSTWIVDRADGLVQDILIPQ